MPRVGIDREGVDRGQHARAHQEGAEKREREGQDGEQDRPDLQGIALFHDDGGMQQRGAGKPGHQATHSRPGPRTTSRPSRVRNRPSRSPWRCRASGRSRRQRPGPHDAGPDRVDAPIDQRRAWRKRRRSRSRHSRCRAAADGSRGRDPAAAGSGPALRAGPG